MLHYKTDEVQYSLPMENLKMRYIAMFGTLVFVGVFAYISFFPSEQEKKAAEPLEIIVGTENQDLQGVTVQVLEEKDDKTPQPSVFASPVTLPDLQRPVQFPASVHPQFREGMKSKIDSIVALLQQDSNLLDEWISLGLLRKSIEDYEGAREAWEYASAIRPKNSVSFGNLAMLYGYYLQDPILAEKNYLQSIENDPKFPYLYVQAADFYLEVLNHPEKAREILQKGLKEIPEEPSFKAILERIQ